MSTGGGQALARQTDRRTHKEANCTIGGPILLGEMKFHASHWSKKGYRQSVAICLEPFLS